MRFRLGDALVATAALAVWLAAWRVYPADRHLTALLGVVALLLVAQRPAFTGLRQWVVVPAVVALAVLLPVAAVGLLVWGAVAASFDRGGGPLVVALVAALVLTAVALASALRRRGGR